MPGSIVKFSLVLINTLIYKLVDIIANLYSFLQNQRRIE